MAHRVLTMIYCVAHFYIGSTCRHQLQLSLKADRFGFVLTAFRQYLCVELNEFLLNHQACYKAQLFNAITNSRLDESSFCAISWIVTYRPDSIVTFSLLSSIVFGLPESGKAVTEKFHEIVVSECTFLQRYTQHIFLFCSSYILIRSAFLKMTSHYYNTTTTLKDFYKINISLLCIIHYTFSF